MAATSEEKAREAVPTIDWRKLRKPALGLFAIAATGLSAWWLDRQQQAFGEEFAMA